MAKYIKDVFNDYIENNNLLDAEIENINLYQKSNKLQISVISSKQIELADIDNFEKYLIKRFKVTKASIDIKYNNIQIEPNIEENWINIVNYIAKKEPFSRAVLNRSHVEITDNEIIVKLATKGADFLLSKKFDKGLEHLFLNLYNKNYKVTFVEEIDENEKAKFEESLRKQEDEYVKKLQEEYERQKQEQSNDLKSLEKEMEMQLNSGKLIQSD
jgi:DNA polymerase III alpha subunit (gram-positive type)